MAVNQEELRTAVDVAEWRLLRHHLERGGLIYVGRELDLTEAGSRIAADDTDAVGAWIAAGALAKPTLDQIVAWDVAPETLFNVLIISPYVLIQPAAEQCQ